MKPSYYDKFTCIADKCEFTCCQEWKIGVDEETLKSWKNENAKELLRDANDYNGEHLSDYVITNADNTVIKLCDNRTCPFLNENKLCNIVLKHGEGFISDTCHTFPRETHEFENHTEQTLMLCCPYVIDLLNDEKKFELVEKEENLSELFTLREKIIEFLQEDNDSIENKLLIIYYILLECFEKDEYDKDIWLLVPELKNTIKKMETSSIDRLNECNELTLDLIDNYLKEGVYKEYLTSINEEALKLEKFLESVDELTEEENRLLNEFENVWKQYETLMTKCLAQEIFGELIIDEDDFEAVLVKYQWIIMEYTLIKQFCYLQFRNDKELTYKKIKESIVIALRIMGFDDDDIYEYMENSFEELVWDWGYPALLLI